MVCVCCSPRPALVAHRGMVGSPGRESPNPGSPTLRAIADPNDFLKGTSPYRDAMKAVPKDQQSPRIPPPLPGEPDLTGALLDGHELSSLYAGRLGSLQIDASDRACSTPCISSFVSVGFRVNIAFCLNQSTHPVVAESSLASSHSVPERRGCGWVQPSVPIGVAVESGG